MAGHGSTDSPAAKAFTLEPYSYAEARAIAAELEVAEPIAVTLVRRGYRTVEDARRFLDATDDHDPFDFESMTGITARLLAAVEAGTRITVHGDYDVDGVCSTAILVRTLRELGAECDWYIPDRLGDGYGLTLGGVETLANRGTGLLVTVDCGIACAEEVEAAHRAGMEVIVTDHHEPPEALPDCPILHPVLSGYPCAELCATGVAYKLAAALRGADAVARELDLVALATVADLVPLRGENRSLVRRGLAEARRARRPGLRALMAVASVSPERLDEGDIAFRLAPRINAAGRLYRADAGVELMLTSDEPRAAAIAAELEDANRERRRVEDDVLTGAEQALRALPSEHAEGAALVIAGEGWHPGVVGIVASRLVERHWRPVVLIGLDGEGRGRGSGRSVPGFDLLEGLRACDEHLLRYGGHRAAAGVEIAADRVDAFREAFVAHADGVLADAVELRTEPMDAVVGGESLGHDVAEQIQRLAPFGLGNPAVNWLVPSATLTDVRPMGEGERHARFSLRSGPSRALGVAFGANGEVSSCADSPLDVSVRLELNEWNGAVGPRVVLGDLYLPEPEAEAGEPHDGRIGEAEFWERLESESAMDLTRWPPPDVVSAVAAAGCRREVVDRRGASGIAAVAALASSGETVLALSADALRRRELVERAARPARFGGGEMAVVSGRLSSGHVAGSLARLDAAGAGVALADWPALAANPALAQSFAHIVVVDPAPFSHLDDLAAAGEGYLHLLCGRGETDLALRALADEWPQRETLAWHFRALRRAAEGDALTPAEAYATLSGVGHPYPRAPEVAARYVRVFEEVGLVRWHESGAERSLGVVSSEGIDLGQSRAFLAYSERLEEGKRWLNERRQSA